MNITVKAKHFLIILLVLTGLVFLIASCDPMDKRLKIRNDSDREIYFAFSCDSSLEANNANIVLESISKKSKINYRMWGIKGWEKYIKDCPNQKINFYFYQDSSTIKNFERDAFPSKILVKHIMVSLKQLKQNNWTIEFP